MPPPDDNARALDQYALLEWVDAIADRFEAGWRSGRPPRIGDYLDDSVGEKRIALLRELARIDLERRTRAGEGRRWEDYLREFPELAEAEEASDFFGRPTGDFPPDEPLSVGAAAWPVLEGYDVLADLGHGGMGSVYKARQRNLKRIVALKMIRPGARADPRYLARFRTEAEAVARLQHPNIAQIYDVGEREGVPYLVLEYVDGDSLSRRLAGKPQPARQAAELVATLAGAIQYAHARGVVHRDLKPDNILVQRGKGEWPRGNGNQPDGSFRPEVIPKITDFGLAKLLEDDAGQSLPGTIVGTPSYMAPEQAEGKGQEVGPAADTYALGVILYEMLTGGPPFKGISVLDTLQQVRSAEPIPPSRLVANIPRDLETICLKAMARAPAGRYASAGALAEDLARFLRGEPIRARPMAWRERAWRWGRRNPARAGLAAAAAVLLATVVVASVLVAAASRGKERARHREGLVQQIQLVQYSVRPDGWSDEVWKLTAEAARLRKDLALRTLAAAGCAGLDARPAKHLENARVSSLAFDDAGRRLLVGARDHRGGEPLEGARLWDLDTGHLVVSQQGGPGPVAFARDGTPLQLVPRGRDAVLLWDLSKQRLVREYHLGPPLPEPSPLLPNERGSPVLALSRDAGVAALGAPGGIAVWDAGSGREVFRVSHPAGALALAPGGNLLAVADARGRIATWRLPEGKSERTWEIGAVTVHCLSFSPDGKRLAVGDSAGAVTVWDVRAGLPVAYCRGSHHAVYALAFSPDGTLLASGGGGPARLWDAATGRLLLSLRTTGLIAALAFAPDGRRLVVGARRPARVTVWDLEGGRGIDTLYGLTSQAARLGFSEDGRLLAALGHDGQIAVWDLGLGHLRHLLPAPKGKADEDAALAFRPDGGRLACSAGEEAKLWDLETGRELASWRLPPGARDLLAFHPSGALLSFRDEAEEPARPGAPRVRRIRNLLGPSPSAPIAILADFDGHFLGSAVVPDGSTFLAEGTYRGPDGQRRCVKAYDSLTGTERWSIASTRSQLSGSLALDPTGRLLALRIDNRDRKGILADVGSGQVLGDLEPFPVSLGPGGDDLVRLGAGNPRDEARGYALFRRGGTTPLLVLGSESPASFPPIFSRDGRLLAWSNTDGTVSVCDLPRVRERLSEVGLGW